MLLYALTVALLYPAIKFISESLILGKTKDGQFCGKQDDALIPGTHCFVISILLRAILSFLLGSFAMRVEMLSAVKTKKCTKDWTALSNTTQILQMKIAKAVCLFAIAIDRTYSAKQNDN